MQPHQPSSRFLSILQEAYQSGSFIKLTLSQPRLKSSDLKNIFITPVQLKKGLMLNFVFRHQTRDITKNYVPEEGVVKLQQALEADFRNADMYLQDSNVKLMISPSGKAKLKTMPIEPIKPVSLRHDHTKQRSISLKDNVYLRELGIANAEGDLRHEMKDKYLQINRYIELLAPELRLLPAGKTLNVADMGSGKGYLTFALYDYLHHTAGIEANITGVEYRPDLVNVCNAIAAQCGFEMLQFVQGTIEDVALATPDVLIALHACDTATDDAIFKGIEAGAALIVCAPCCHKQIRRDMQPEEILNGIMKHGILQERQAEIITDAMRALILQAHGYKTRVFEFISSEHTAKNLMLVGRKIKLKPADGERYLTQLRALKQLYGIRQHYLEKLLSI